ncbi:branched-chain amino acid ABC transporter permease [Actinomadura darangshiensis]|uniref:Branched-chain amino acid ABC transporter permease n=1 Tax=Actinomadura darangshiensis TaxID=705336 RepID=A0A4R5BMF9_9ACTN|nr:branched-chain amino acid ABC transporter permease [Actinomadura darangshiensis]TDD87971.1 branched-chain amino acid ABC transporter permease [Actinomadura darangshiensis]
MRLANLLVDGLSLGLIYALISIGFVVIFRGTKTPNFAHGSMLVLGTFVVASLHSRLGFGGALAAGILVSAVSGLLVNRIAMLPTRDAGTDVRGIITIGLNVILTAELTRRLGANIMSTGAPWGDATLSAGGLRLPVSRLCALLVSVLIIGGFMLVNRYTMMGLSARATAEDPEIASMVGARLRRVSDSAWILGGVFAAVAGVFLTTYPSAGLVVGTSEIAILAFPAAVIGGLDSVGGAVAGGLLVGLSQSLVSGYHDRLDFLGHGFDTVAPWILMVAVLLWRPHGLFGKRPLYRI